MKNPIQTEGLFCLALRPDIVREEKEDMKK
jgi:hypothetical protein